MHNGNPHAPTTSWLESIAGGAATIEADDVEEVDPFTGETKGRE